MLQEAEAEGVAGRGPISSLVKTGELKSQGTQNNVSCNKFNFFHFSKQSNFLLVGTADGNLVIFEDNTIKVNIEYILHKSVFLKTWFYVLLPYVIIRSLITNIIHSTCYLCVDPCILAHNRS